MTADESLGPLSEPDRQCDRDPDQHPGGEHVLGQSQPPLVSDRWDREPGKHALPRRLDDRREEDEESPEDQRVHDPWEGSLEEFALSKDVGAFPGRPRTEIPRPRDRTPG